MKKIILTAILVISIIGGKVFAAGEEGVSRQAKETFSKEFPSAEFAKWEEISNSGIFLVRFVYNNQGFVAYFNEVGMMIASARLVTVENLPYKVSQVIRKQYAGNEIIKIEELTMESTLSYFFTLQNEKAKSLIRVYHDGTVQKVNEEKKKSSSSK